MSPAATRFDTDHGSPYGIAVASDGAVWTTLVHTGEVARLTSDGQVGRYPVGPKSCKPSIITRGVDGAMWFSRNGDGCIGRITVDGSTSTLAQDTDGAPFGLCEGPDGAMWFTDMAANAVGRITAAGDVARFALTRPDAYPSFITAGPDGALWLTLNGANAIAHVTTDGEVSVHPLPTSGAGPVGITATIDAIWFVEIAAAPSGGCWFSQWATNCVGHITSLGEITEHALPDAASEPHGIAVDGRGAVWVAMESGSVIRVEPGDSP
jgi:virginiamycin B lyase